MSEQRHQHHDFYRCELRALQFASKDNDEFLNTVAGMVARLTQERDDFKHDLGMAEHRIRVLENGGE